jgi:hypothetical protein
MIFTKEECTLKKTLIAVVLTAAAIGVGYFAYRFSSNHVKLQPSDAQVSSAVQLPSSEASLASQQVVSSKAPVLASSAYSRIYTASSSATTTITKAQEPSVVKSEVKLDWKKYTLKPGKPKKLNGKTYNTYEIWDEDYLEGPNILVDPTDSKVYTWTSSDTNPIPAAKDKAFDKTPHTIVGTMKDGAMMSILLTTDDGNELTIRRLGVDTSGLKSLKIGDRIKVTYTGVIKGNDTSRAFITKLENA